MSRSLCTVCNRTFGGVGAFDDHRKGAYTQGKVQPQLRRRCLSDQEMLDRGMTQKNGVWSNTAVGFGPGSHSKREQANLRISQAQHDLEFLNKEIARLESIKAQREEALSA